MERKYKYFIEDADTHEWYWAILDGEFHRTSSNPHYRCGCMNCRGIKTVGFTNDPNEAFGFLESSHAEDVIKRGLTRCGLDDAYIKDLNFYKGDTGYKIRNLIVTEHEFVDIGGEGN